MRLDDALMQIADIRLHMGRSAVFRGYRSATVALSGILGLAAAAAQPLLVPSPADDLTRYLVFWVSVASASVMAAGLQMWWRTQRFELVPVRQLALLAIEQFLPSIVVGALLTLCIWLTAPHVAWMLPGLWALVFSMGIFASHRLLPRPVFWVGAWYVGCGCGALLWGRGEHVLSPWLMGISFGGGQLLAASVLYCTLERDNGQSPNEGE